MRSASAWTNVRYHLRARGRALLGWWCGVRASIDEYLADSIVDVPREYGTFSNRTQRERIEFGVTRARPKKMVRSYLDALSYLEHRLPVAKR